MNRTRPSAITFDFWNTLYSTDEGAMTPVRPLRLAALRRLLALAGAHPTDDELHQAYVAGFDEYMAAWTGGRHHGAREHALFLLEYFRVDSAQVAGEALERAVTEMEDASLKADLRLLPGARETIPALTAAGHRLGLISDTSLTPGRILQRFLERDGLLEHLSVLTFSDETGYPKPDRRMFLRTLEALGAEPQWAAHVGDTPRTDIAGAQGVGMTAIRCAAAADQEGPPAADFVIRDHREIPAIVAGLGWG